MKIRIEYVADRGDMYSERLVLRARSDADIGDFMLLRTGFEDDEVTTEIKNTLWFPYERISAGDIVVIYSKTGHYKKKKLRDNRSAHFFYWNQESPLWDDDDAVPVLLYAPKWTSKTLDELLPQRWEFSS